MMECTVCNLVVHPTCETDYGVEGVVSSKQPNTWYCPKCMKFNPPEEEPEEVKRAKLEEEEAQLVKQEEEYMVRGTSTTSKLDLRIALSEKIVAASKKQLKMPSFVFRPPPRLESVTALLERRQREPDLDIRLEFDVLLPVFR